MDPCVIKPAADSQLRDESGLVGRACGVACPESAEALAALMAQAAGRGERVTVQGALTGLVGGAVPQGGLVVSLSRMDGILRAEKEETGGVLLAQAGASLEQVDAEARRLGCFFAPNPTEQTATLGGVYATGAAGPRGQCYGAASRFVRRLRWCTPAGTLWDIPRGDFVFDADGCPLPDGGRLACRTDIPCALLPFGTPRPGLDLIDFLAGSEGRLGVVAELEIDLLPRPAALWGVLYFWRRQQDAADFIAWLAQSEADARHLEAAEFMDGAALQTIRAARTHHSLLKTLPDLPAAATAALYVQLAGDDPEALEEALYRQLERFAAQGGREEDTWAVEGEEEAGRLRGLTHALTELAGEAAAEARQNGLDGARIETDFTGPGASFADSLVLYQQDMRAAGVNGFVYGHALQNVLHAVLLPQNAPQQAAVHTLVRDWAAQTAQNGGRLANEHGLGRLKEGLVEALLPEECREQRQRIKSLFDPKGGLP